MSQNCVILNARTLSKRAAREARKAREARDALLAREGASERERDREYVGAGKEEDARRRATGYLSLPVSYSAGGPGGGGGRGVYQPVRRLSGFFCCLHIISWIKKIIFLLPGILVAN